MHYQDIDFRQYYLVICVCVCDPLEWCAAENCAGSSDR